MNEYMIFVLLINFVYTATPIRTYTEGYYWRDYEGIIPTDTVQGGLDKNGKPIYIGQALYESKLIPGKIYQDKNNIYYEWKGKELSTSENIKILCSQYPEKFEWVATKHNEVVLLTNKLLIKGGYQKDYSTYIGRVFSSGETSVGKVICRETDCLGLYTVNDGKRTEHKNAFEILTYNPKINGTYVNNCNPPIDTRFNS